MHTAAYSSVNKTNGNITWDGPLSLEKGNHSGMPARTDAYLYGDERGHINASSLGGVNNEANVAAQHHDVNHGAYLSMENGERTALQSGADIHSEKTAFVDSQPGDRPATFTVNDTVTYADGHTENIHSSFTNESYASQEAWNDMSSGLSDTYDGANPGDTLRESMSSEEYAELMEETDASLLNLDAEYAPVDFSGDPYGGTACEDDIAADSSPGDSVGDSGVGDEGMEEGGIDDDEGVDDGMDI